MYLLIAVGLGITIWPGILSPPDNLSHMAGVCYLINSFSHFLSPAFAATLFPGLFGPIFVAELSLAVWLTVKGVNVAKWEEKAGVSAP